MHPVVFDWIVEAKTFLSKFQERAERVAKKKALVDFNSEGKKKQNYIIFILHHRSIVFR